ncbi:MAG: hypothetical protein OXC00_07370 [Acidimicrobiaceae bacterium]|nr:hypothetical protein [Acidimicrobiaceae bacterium]
MLEVSGMTTRYGSISALRRVSLPVAAVVEQNATRLLEAADRAYVLRTGEIAAEGAAAGLLGRDDLFDTFVGAARDSHAPDSEQP